MAYDTPIYKKSTGELVTRYSGANALSDAGLLGAGYSPDFYTTVKSEPNIILSSTPNIGGKAQPTKTEYFSGSTPVAEPAPAPITRAPVGNLPIRTIVAQGGEAGGAAAASSVAAPARAGVSSGVTNPVTSYNSSTPSVSRYGAAFEPGGIFYSTPVTAEDEDKIREKARKDVQAQIDAINELTATELAAARQAGAERIGQTRALGAATGTAGSPMGDAQIEKTRGVNSAEERAIQAATGERISNILAGVNTRADTLIQTAKTTSRENAGKYMEFLKAQSTDARTDMKELATAGAELTTDQRQNLIDQTGYDPDTFDQIYQGLKIANSNDYINKDKPEIVGNKAVFFKKNKDGTITTETVDLPVSEGVDPKDIDVVARKDGIYMLNKRDGTFKKIGQPEVSQEEIDKATEKSAAKKAAADEIAENYGLTNELLNLGDSALNAIAGVPGFSNIVPGTKTQLALNKAKQLKAVLSLENRQKLKGQGAVSDFEGKMIADAGSSIGINDAGRSNLSNEDFKKETRKVRGAFGLAAGQPQKVRITSPDGKTKEGEVTSEEANSAYLQGYLIEFID